MLLRENTSLGHIRSFFPMKKVWSIPNFWPLRRKFDLFSDWKPPPSFQESGVFSSDSIINSACLFCSDRDWGITFKKLLWAKITLFLKPNHFPIRQSKTAFSLFWRSKLQTIIRYRSESVPASLSASTLNKHIDCPSTRGWFPEKGSQKRANLSWGTSKSRATFLAMLLFFLLSKKGQRNKSFPMWSQACFLRNSGRRKPRKEERIWLRGNANSPWSIFLGSSRRPSKLTHRWTPKKSLSGNTERRPWVSILNGLSFEF